MAADASSSSSPLRSTADRDHLEPAVASVIALFEGPLADAHFPGVDRASLAELEGAVAEARVATDAARDALVRAQSALVECERALVAHEGALLARAHRALAYARVYAADAPELAGAVSGIELPVLPVRAPSTDRAEPRRRGRPTKVKAGAPLFEAPSNDATGDASSAESTEPSESTDVLA